MLMRAVTVIVNQMMEGQKRLCAQIYNEAGVIPKDQPIPSFVRWPQEVHKKIDRSHLKLKDNWEEFIKEGNKSFFSRSSVGIRVFLYNGRKESPFLSIGQVFIIHCGLHSLQYIRRPFYFCFATGYHQNQSQKPAFTCGQQQWSKPSNVLCQPHLNCCAHNFQPFLAVALFVI